ncbi:centrosomal protein of 97 kDa-like [Sinocyclocheilus rhinocerous]|uniref:centrosomal protein of 97 kDa-like n=1 Tax=Sinocyclocheilus rhinocerous TaxID=307959 RepID=UPI0007B8F157|nr:PREDICTED: centrosomal protein of 97 kDa-like [Sinocyclocheilus rhinocerous]XP_016422882.1 PREDICTED: centrosomal protein of 97 kDa-like [Sinocyclocheilus rhinocerous]
MAATDGEIIVDPLLQMSNYEGPGLLDLSNQSLHKLNPKIFSHVESHTLILDQNHIIKLEHLERNQVLQQLSAACNRLVRMMGVSKLIHLRTLNLPNNSIGYIEGLKDLVHLEWLNLAGNNIKVIEQLNNCASLQHLDMSDNNISHIGDLTKLSALKTLLLHGNIITTLRTVPAHLPTNLTVLSLAENEIRDLTEVSYLAPLHSLEQLSMMSNPCVMATPSLPGCDYRPYVVSWCLSLKVLDGYVVSQKEGLKGEWLYSQGKGRMFHPGQHAQLVQYLASTCPLTATTALESAEDAKLERILNKQRQHQKQLQQTRHCCSSPSRPTHLDVQQRRIHKNKDGDVIAQADVNPGVQVNTWMDSVSSPVVAAARLPPAAEDMMTLEDVHTDEEKLQGSLLSSESAFLPFNTAVHPASAPDSGEEEFDDSLAPPTSTQYHPSKEESVDRAVLTLTQGSDHVDHIDRTACSDINGQQHAFNGDAGLQNGTVEDSKWTGMQKAAVLQCKVKQCEPHDAAVRIQSWWRGHWTRYCHPQAKEVRAEIRLRRMQDHIVHLTVELERVRKQQEEDRLQRRVQEEAVKFLWKQLQVVLEWQSSVNEQLNVAKSTALDPSIPAATPIHTEISIPESGFHSPGERQAALDNSLSSTATTGSPETVRSLGPLTAATGDSQDGSLLEQYLSSVQRQDEEEEEDKGTGDRTGTPQDPSDLSPHGKDCREVCRYVK